MFTRRFTAVAAGVVLGAVALAGQAFAHVEVSAKPAQALAQNAVVSFSAEAENGSAGISSVRVVLPQGIAPADVTLVAAPSGWKLTPTADGYTVAGTTLKVKTDAAYKIKVKQLPNAKTIAFKTLVTYSNGDVDRWIELPSASDPNPEHPAPVLKLAAAAPGASPTEASLVTPAPSDSVSPSTGTPEAATATASSAAAPASAPTGVGGWIVLTVLAGVALALGVTLARRKAARRAG
ncbi:MAG: DUF1775 domain-containing protein [Hamadaea sp.]|uniref:DUF1775 domain-containing protein n=1 Tax=Hamadaea sp. TaxID=2024425 RepID=UPI0017A1625C|nr:DUF1775 domain-containing protein [Hamadaea sp.]NUT21914.1 DUF1775 domain-containing protein [Hamadaea sp.]